MKTLVQYNLIESDRDFNLDYYLSQGWTRCNDFYIKAPFLCLDKKVSSIINIRHPLNTYSAGRRHRRIKKKVEKDFKVIIKPFSLSEEKEQLYESFKERLYGFIYTQLEDYFSHINDNSVFNTREINVYDNKKLIAVSFFDQGEKSINSLLCLYDLSYRNYSLGVYTMLKEVEYGLGKGCEYYYPGYILDNNPSCDYKMNIGKIEYLDNNSLWVPMNEYKPENSSLITLKEKTSQIEKELLECGIPFQKRINPFYAYGYINLLRENFIKCIIAVVISPKKTRRKFSIEYDTEQDIFALSEIEKTIDYNFLFDLQNKSYYEKDDIYLSDLYVYKKIFKKSSNIKKIIRKHLLPIITLEN